MKFTKLGLLMLGSILLNVQICAANAPLPPQDNKSSELKDVMQQRKDASKRRAAIAQQLSENIKESHEKGLRFSKELAAVVQKLACLENLGDKKRTGEQIKDARITLELAKKQFVASAENEQFAKNAKALANALAQEEQLFAKQLSLQNKVCGNASCANNQICSGYLKPLLAFAAGGAVIAFLHWRKFITIPQV